MVNEHPFIWLFTSLHVIPSPLSISSTQVKLFLAFQGISPTTPQSFKKKGTKRISSRKIEKKNNYLMLIQGLKNIVSTKSQKNTKDRMEQGIHNAIFRIKI